MILNDTKIPGVFLIESESVEDERGGFEPTWCPNEFESEGLDPRLAQVAISHNKRKGTLRGMHYQASPHAAAKSVRCTMGAVYDVALDLRPDSPTYKEWVAAELTAENRRMLYIPAGCAHGFQTMVDHTEILYLISVQYHAELARGVRWNDPAFGIQWPHTAKRIINRRDANDSTYVS